MRVQLSIVPLEASLDHASVTLSKDLHNAEVGFDRSDGHRGPELLWNPSLLAVQRGKCLHHHPVASLASNICNRWSTWLLYLKKRLTLQK